MTEIQKATINHMADKINGTEPLQQLNESELAK